MPALPKRPESLKAAFFVGAFPAVSETFIIRQIRALIASAHEVDIFADTRDALNAAPVDDETNALLDRATYMDMPQETTPWEMPAWPIYGRTWLPGAATPISNLKRVARALPKFACCFKASPRLALRMVNKEEYGYRARSFSQVYRMARLAEKQRKYDVLHAHFGPVAESFRFARDLWRAPLIASFHGYDFTTIPRKEGKHVYKNLFAAADAITGNSEYTVQCLVELGCPKEKVRRLPMGLDLQQFPFRERSLAPDEPVRILVVARLTPIKGVEFAIDAISEARQRHSNVQLDIVGDGPSRPELEQRARKLGLENIVHFHGARSGKTLQALRDAAHIFLHLSVTVDGDQEGQGVVLQEAQAVGLPVVATRHGAFPEGVLDGESAFLVPERDPRATADVLLFLIGHPEVWPEMGRKGRAFVTAKYNIERLNEELIGLYREVIANFQPA